ncbi:MAG: hypothetical protein A3F54_01385 [Candidatus Kerfeldbacteria bacterium RIFCSPHIGHO2_12_FULL_48_17]|uniref:DNA polymerase III subunit delta n=1 Tax=Candidatus Kerfeldbacteria bacterium RIFCSPHIGHO2_12_FULL_48_17 TaxID=1798542 RepID=A0A1G2AYV5_9BACT|nr:MAG: hypothetical protein A3F54_01385 [Candidatus Kerfeldbacteria bacterium RIFCSPHIGHO2_12_FULL_48_17]
MNHMQHVWPVVGHNFVQEYLEKSLISGKISHAYIFHGPGHIGKAPLVRFFVAALVCQSRHDRGQTPGSFSAVACGVCPSCLSWQKSTHHSDVYWFDQAADAGARSAISIQTVRELHKHETVSTFFSPYKIGVIDGAQFLTLEASNALLKMLEEPPKNAVVILIAETLHHLPKTLISRCHIVPMFPVGQGALYPWLVDRLGDREDALNLSRESFGRPGKALAFVADPSLRADFHKVVVWWLEIFEAESLAQRFGRLDSAWPRSLAGQSLRNWAQNMIVHGTTVARDVIYLQLGHEEYVHSPSFSGRLRSVAQKYETVELLFHIDRLQKAQESLRKNMQPKLLFDSLLASL